MAILDGSSGFADVYSVFRVDTFNSENLKTIIIILLSEMRLIWHAKIFLHHKKHSSPPYLQA